MKTKTLKQIMDEGWSELREIGFNHKCVVYQKEDRRMIYDTDAEFVISEYLAPTGRKE